MLHLVTRDDGLALCVDEPLGLDVPDVSPKAIDRVEAALAAASAPPSLKALRSAVKMRAVTGRAQRCDKGYALVSQWRNHAIPDSRSRKPVERDTAPGFRAQGSA